MKYRKKPVVIEAIQFTLSQDYEYLFSMFGSAFGEVAIPYKDSIKIKTLEGDHTASMGDYIIKGVKGEFYPCKPDIFEMTYEKLDELNERSGDVDNNI